jgi:acetyltransferase-like isoleucine patch superfamily enzyme
MGLVSRAAVSMKQLSFADLVRKVLFVLLKPARAVRHYYRRLRFYFHTKCWVHYILGEIHIRTINHNTTIGREACFYHNTVLEITEMARLRIGNNFTLSYGSVISCQHSIRIGDYVMIGEYSSLRDASHVYDTPGVPYCQQHDAASEIVIGNNVWIGRGSVILPGAVIEDGVIVAANSVVKGRLEAYSMYGGAPVKLIKRLPTAP